MVVVVPHIFVHTYVVHRRLICMQTQADVYTYIHTYFGMYRCVFMCSSAILVVTNKWFIHLTLTPRNNSNNNRRQKFHNDTLSSLDGLICPQGGCLRSYWCGYECCYCYCCFCMFVVVVFADVSKEASPRCEDIFKRFLLFSY